MYNDEGRKLDMDERTHATSGSVADIIEQKVFAESDPDAYRLMTTGEAIPPVEEDVPMTFRCPCCTTTFKITTVGGGRM
jgi:hypothetical protein